MQKHIQHKDERTQFFRKIYLSFYWKGFEKVMKGFVWEVSWRRNKDCNILTPTLLAIAAFLSHSPGLLNWGPVGPASAGSGSHSSTATSDFKLWSPTHWLPVAPGLYNCLTPTCFLWRHNSHSIQPVDSQGYPRYLRLDAPVIYTGAFFIWQLDQVRGQYVTLLAWTKKNALLIIYFVEVVICDVSYMQVQVLMLL